MKKFFLIAILACISSCLFAHGNGTDSVQQYLLIVRYKTNMPVLSVEAQKANAAHWGQFIGQLAQSGKLVTGIRPGTDGRTIAGSSMETKKGAHESDKEVVSSIFVIRASSMEEAAEIAKKCPIYELGGSVEIRPVINATN